LTFLFLIAIIPPYIDIKIYMESIGKKDNNGRLARQRLVRKLPPE
jgi:hypothetical protein